MNDKKRTEKHLECQMIWKFQIQLHKDFGPMVHIRELSADSIFKVAPILHNAIFDLIQRPGIDLVVRDLAYHVYHVYHAYHVYQFGPSKMRSFRTGPDHPNFPDWS